MKKYQRTFDFPFVLATPSLFLCVFATLHLENYDSDEGALYFFLSVSNQSNLVDIEAT